MIFPYVAITEGSNSFTPSSIDRDFAGRAGLVSIAAIAVSVVVLTPAFIRVWRATIFESFLCEHLFALIRVHSWLNPIFLTEAILGSIRLSHKQACAITLSIRGTISSVWTDSSV